MQRSLHIILISTFVLLIPLCSEAQPNRLFFTPHWLPQAEFSGFYVAKDQGFYRELGLAVEIVHPSVTENALVTLTSGRADIISLFLVTALTARTEGIDLVNFAQLSQHSAIMMVSMKDSGIETLQDFNGKRIGIWMSGFEAGGDMYDFSLIGKRFYFAIGDVSGKGETGYLEYANARHNPPVLISKTGKNCLIEQAKAIPLGLFEDFFFTDSSLQLQDSDKIFGYTDGVSEAENARDDLFGDPRMLELIEANSSCSPRELIERVETAIVAHVKDHPQSDDITMITILYDGKG